MDNVFVFWQNAPNHLQAPWLSALAGRQGARVIVATESGNDLPAWRRDLGWQLPKYGDAKLEVSITKEKSARIIEDEGSRAIHIFTGVGAYPMVHDAFLQCRKAGRRLGLLAERTIPGGLLAGPRFAKGRLICQRFRGCVEFVLGVGAGAPPWYEMLGYDARLVFEFAYFPPLPPIGEEPQENIWPADKVRLLFIGQMDFRKGIDLLIGALEEVDCSEWVLNLLGSGKKQANFQRLAEKPGIGDRVTFRGSLPNPEAMAVLAGADVLILPSRFDGYGAVVNEALFRGVPVICSAATGARQVVERDPDLGTVFSDQNSLRAALEQWVRRGRRTEKGSVRVRTLSQCVSPDAAADYFLEIMEHVFNGGKRPVAPWRRPEGAE